MSEWKKAGEFTHQPDSGDSDWVVLLDDYGMLHLAQRHGDMTEGRDYEFLVVPVEGEDCLEIKFGGPESTTFVEALYFCVLPALPMLPEGD